MHRCMHVCEVFATFLSGHVVDDIVVDDDDSACCCCWAFFFFLHNICVDFAFVLRVARSFEHFLSASPRDEQKKETNVSITLQIFLQENKKHTPNTTCMLRSVNKWMKQKRNKHADKI